MPLDLGRLRANLDAVRVNISAAAARAGRAAAEVTLVAITKYVDAELARALVELGVTDLGESRPQSLWEKGEALADLPVRWHLVGHLQRNKIRRTLPLVSLMHSVDSQRILDALNAEAAREGRTLDVLLEINISGEANKTGLPAAEARVLVPQLPNWPNIRLQGLMGMASLDGDPSANRREFASLRKLREELRALAPAGGSSTLAELSMGMSGDFEVAIEEGATLVRVGSALWEGLA